MYSSVYTHMFYLILFVTHFMARPIWVIKKNIENQKKGSEPKETEQKNYKYKYFLLLYFQTLCLCVCILCAGGLIALYRVATTNLLIEPRELDA